MSFGEQIALRVQMKVEGDAATATFGEERQAGELNGEAQFIERLRAGEAAAFDHLVNERSGDIFALLFRLTEDEEDARDLTQETFLQAFRCVHQFRGEANVKTWLYRIAINLARNRWRWWNRRKRGVTTSLDGQDEFSQYLHATLKNPGQNDPEQDALQHEREQILSGALGKLRRHYREVIILRDVEGLSYEEVAAALSLSIGTVKSRLSRGREELRRILEGVL